MKLSRFDDLQSQAETGDKTDDLTKPLDSSQRSEHLVRVFDFLAAIAVAEGLSGHWKLRPTGRVVRVSDGVR